jgi:hypothetical protein
VRVNGHVQPASVLPDVRTPRSRPRLTALGSGVFAAFAMAVAGAVESLVGGSATAYGLVFVLVSALAALWVSPSDLFMAPVGVPLAYTAGPLVLLPGTADGFGDAVVTLTSVLAVGAGWVYGGTLVAIAVALARRLRARRV